MSCTQPGCTGQILDGYCDVCGSPAPAGATGSSALAPGAPVPGTSATSPVRPMPTSPASAAPVPGTPGTPGTGRGVSSVTVVPASTPRVPAAETPSTATRASSSLASAPLGSARARTRGSRTVRQGTGSTRLRGARLGAGLTTVPPVPPIDPRQALLADPQVPEDRRFCPSCGSPVGRSRDGRPGRTDGFCPKCRSEFSFSPKLKAGDLVGGQYEVQGCLAFGGLGWIYLATDRNVSDRWVVLKGLLNSGDPDALAAAIAERQFLAQVEHPLIVEIYNFVTHEGAGYIVMEYVGGTSLKSLLKQRMRTAGTYDPFPLDTAIAFILEVLPAFGYLHDLGLVYCDFKPDNIIQVGDAVKLIDLGGVRRIDDVDSAIYGTVGYQAPEVADVGPSVASDLYTIGRTLLVLAAEVRGNQTTYATTLPPASEIPLLAEQDSLYRLLLKCCAPDPADRFGSADELRVQLLGVLREIVAEREAVAGRPPRHSASSLLFDPPAVTTSSLGWNGLPGLRIDESDPMAGWLRSVSVDDPAQRLKALAGAPTVTAEVRLARARAALLAGQPATADAEAGALLDDDPWEWRAVWVQGLTALSRGDAPSARAAFNAVYGQVPGELAPKLALALACELSGQDDVAERLYEICARTDANYIAPAAFGLARVRHDRGTVGPIVAALDLIPATSGGWVEARSLRAAVLAEGAHGDLGLLDQAWASLDGVPITPVARAELTVRILGAALAVVAEPPAAPDAAPTGPRARATKPVRPRFQPGAKIGPWQAQESDLRAGLEAAFRRLAEAAQGNERVALVDRANAVRPWTVR